MIQSCQSKTAHTGEFRHVGGDQRRSASQSLRGDQEVIGANRRSCRFQRSAPIAGSHGIFFVEWATSMLPDRNTRNRSAFSRRRWLRATQYESSYSTTVETTIETPRDAIRRKRLRTPRGWFLSSAITALVSRS